MAKNRDPLEPIPYRPADEPLICLKVNRNWLAFLIAVVYPNRYPEAWLGTLEENKQARLDVLELIDLIAQAEDCDNMAECCEDKQRAYRINPDTGEIEVSYDGGVTYETAPGTIYSNAVEPAPLAGEDGDVKRCEAANNVVDNLKDVQSGISSKLELTYTLFDFAVTILVEIIAIVLAGITGGTLAALVVPLIPKIIEIARSIFGLSSAAYDGLFTEIVWTTVRCIAYCHVGENGKFTAQAWTAVKNDLKQQLGSGSTQAGANLAAMVDVWSLVGLNHAAAIGAGTEGNCDDCDCNGCDLTDWTVSAGTEISRTSTEIIAEAAEVSPGDWSVQLTAATDNTCCCNMTYEILSGGVTITVVGYVPCGLPIEGNIGFSYAGGALRWYDLATHDGPYTVKITASECA